MGSVSYTHLDVYKRQVLVCDRESIVAATGTGKGQLLGRQISDAATRLLAMRGPYTAPETAARRITAFDKGETVLLCVCPIVAVSYTHLDVYKRQGNTMSPASCAIST